MIKRGLLGILMSFLILPLNAQVADQLVPHMGFMREFITGFQPNDTMRQQGESLNYYNVNLGTYYAIGHVNDVFSYGIDGSLQFGILPFVQSGRLKTNLVLQTPIYAMVRLGANATPYNTQRVGISLGIGGGYNYISQFTNVSATQKLKTGYFYPDAVAEITLMSRGNPITGRFHVSLADGNSNVRTVDSDGNVLTESPFLFTSIGWGLIYGF